MMFTIKSGSQRAVPFRIGLYFKRYFKWEVEFTESCKYSIGKDQADINKLCGIRYLFGNHSARFGWRYNPEFPDHIELLAYVHDKDYISKAQEEILISRVLINDKIRLELRVINKLYIFYAYSYFDASTNTRVAPRTHKQLISFRQSLRFGGNMYAPHDIHIKIKRL